MKDYKKLAMILCEGMLDEPSGCDGCPLGDTGHITEDGERVCALYEDDSEEVNE